MQAIFVWFGPFFGAFQIVRALKKSEKLFFHLIYSRMPINF